VQLKRCCEQSEAVAGLTAFSQVLVAHDPAPETSNQIHLFDFASTSTHYPLLIPSQVSGTGTHPLSSISTVHLKPAVFPYATQAS